MSHKEHLKDKQESKTPSEPKEAQLNSGADNACGPEAIFEPLDGAGCDDFGSDTQTKAEAESDSESKQSTEKEPKKSTEKESKKPELEKENPEEKIKALQDQYLRLLAEFDNYKRRTSKEYDRLIEQAGERLMVDLLDVRDNFERALKSAKQQADPAALAEGMRLIYEKFDSILRKHGLETFSEPGDEFNPELHDALMKAPHEKIPVDHIAEVFEKGYKLRKKVIKHGRVIVSCGKVETAPATENKKPEHTPKQPPATEPGC
jgi:molecular chaperone GrpE